MYSKQENKYLIAAILALSITVFIIIFSEEAFAAALEGLRVWWEIVFPSLLPFFVIAEILMGLGVVHFLGVLLEPLMRPVFKVPGVGSFALAMGLASGYPIGAKITSNLRRKKLCTKTEAERLLSFTCTANPSFMLGAIAVGMFRRADLGLIIATTHYISSILVGILLRFYRGEESSTGILDSSNGVGQRKNIFSRAVNELIDARRKDGRDIGQLLGDSIKEAINTILMVGGFIILFSVLTRIFIVTGLVNTIGRLLMLVLKPFGISETLILPLISGIFEVTNGANLVSQAQAPLLHQLIMTNILIAWSGLSVHAQIATVINGTDLRIKPFIMARILQSIIAGFLTIQFFRFSSLAETTFLPILKGSSPVNVFSLALLFFLLLLSISLILSLSIYLLRKIKIIFFYHS
ncbi:MAG: sporulation integral membrane protein YlbJ [Halanaerobiales bacterium]